MTTITIEGKVATGPEQFAQMIKDALKRRPVRVTRAVALDPIVEGLTRIRSEWEEVAQSEGTSLIDQTASVGYMLADFARLLGLGDKELADVLGPELADAVI